jgi:hypothetical protein
LHFLCKIFINTNIVNIITTNININIQIIFLVLDKNIYITLI